jgi:hypothetical protein
MAHKWLLLGTIAVVVIGGTSVYQMRSSNLTRGEEKRKLQAELSRLQTQVYELTKAGEQTRLLALRSNVEANGAEPRAESPRPVESEAMKHPVEEPLSLEARKERQQEAYKQEAARLDSALAAEEPDRGWGAATVAAMYQAVRSATASRITKADCAAHLCRVVLEHDSREEQKSLAENIHGKAPFDQEIFFRYDKQSTPLTTTMYVAREGSSLAMLGR